MCPDQNTNDMDTKVKKWVLSGAFLLFSLMMEGQKFYVGTNSLGYANFLTINAEFGMAVAKNWTIMLNGKYNPFTYNAGEASGQLQNKQMTVSAGARYWPFYVYSGFFYGAKMQFSSYNQGGIISKETTEGNAAGLGLLFGYSLLITRWLNLEFGAGFWGGGKKYTTYACPRCGRIIGSGSKFFIAPNDAMVNIVFTF